MKQWMKARTIGAPPAVNRQLGFRTMRKTKPVEKIPPTFVLDPDYSGVRTEKHREKFPNYPNPIHNMKIVGNY